MIGGKLKAGQLNKPNTMRCVNFSKIKTIWQVTRSKMLGQKLRSPTKGEGKVVKNRKEFCVLAA